MTIISSLRFLYIFWGSGLLCAAADWQQERTGKKSLWKTRQTNAPWWTMQNCNCTCLATLFHEGLWKTITIIIIVHDLENFNITLYYFRNEFFVSNSSPLKMVLKCYFYSRLFIKGFDSFCCLEKVPKRMFDYCIFCMVIKTRTQ